LPPLATPVVPGVQPAQLHPREPKPGGLVEHQFDAVAVHHVGWVDVERDDEPFGVDQHVTLAPDQLVGPVLPTDASHAGGLDGLAVDAAGAGLGIAVQPYA
jgi:hypothetical protein